MSNLETHSLIKTFTSPLSPDGSLPAEVCSQVSAFVAAGDVCARSIDVEFVVSHGVALVSLGYSKEAGLPVSVSCVKASKLEAGTIDTERLSDDLTAAVPPGGVICHAFYIDAEDDVYAVFLSLTLV